MLLHKDKTDYVVILDHHEDVVILDSEHQPTCLEGFQIKTAQSNWTIKALLKRESGSGTPPALLPSILGKLYDVKLRFQADVKVLQFVSNEPVSVR